MDTKRNPDKSKQLKPHLTTLLIAAQKFQCAQCFKFFATEKLLRGHVVRHVNCYKCTMCDMTCSSASSLTTHIRYRHLKDKPFKCSECDTRCVRESDLAKHVQIVHSKTIHQCDQPGCQYSVRTYTQMRRVSSERANGTYPDVAHALLFFGNF